MTEAQFEALLLEVLINASLEEIGELKVKPYCVHIGEPPQEKGTAHFVYCKTHKLLAV